VRGFLARTRSMKVACMHEWSFTGSATPSCCPPVGKALLSSSWAAFRRPRHHTMMAIIRRLLLLPLLLAALRSDSSVGGAAVVTHQAAGGSGGGGGGAQHLPAYLTFYDYNATAQASFCNLGTATTKPNRTVLTNTSALIQGWAQHGLPGLLDVEDIGGGFNRGLYFRGGLNTTHLNPDWKRMLGAVLDSALPWIEKGAIKGVRPDSITHSPGWRMAGSAGSLVTASCVCACVMHRRRFSWATSHAVAGCLCLSSLRQPALSRPASRTPLHSSTLMNASGPSPASATPRAHATRTLG
jgi:hypothetical protein